MNSIYYLQAFLKQSSGLTDKFSKEATVKTTIYCQGIFFFS